MSFSYTGTDTVTFTRTHAKHLAAKVATDLKRLQRLYGKPSDKDIDDYEAEIIEFLLYGYLNKVTYGFRRNGRWITPTLRYTAADLMGGSLDDHDPGRIRPGAYIGGSSFYSYLTCNEFWRNASAEDRQAFERLLPFQRIGAPEPGAEGRWTSDLTYSSGGRALERATLRS